MNAITRPFWMPQLTGQESKLVTDVLASNFLNDGKVTAEFEKQFAQRLSQARSSRDSTTPQPPFAVAVTSGTTALTLALMALGVGKGDEVLVPDITFIATANAVSLTGATPVLVDIDPSTLNVDPGMLERAITPRTKAIVPVHVSGRAADMEAIMNLARRKGLRVVEDAAEAFMSQWRGRALGTIGDLGAFSLSPNKTITSGQGGVVVTHDEKLYNRLRELKDQGRPVRGTGGADTHVSLGFNFKFTNLQAAVALGQLSELNRRLGRMRAIHRGYLQGLEGVKGIRLFESRLDDGEILQWVDADVERRDELDTFLLARGMQCRRFWFPIHTQTPYQTSDEKFPNSTKQVRRSLWLPSAFTLSDEDVREICQAIREFAAEAG